MFTGVVIDVDPDDRPAWLDWRRGGIGGSDLAALLGWSPWSSPMALYLEKTGQLLADGDEAEHLRWGRLLEDAIAGEFSAREGLHLGAAQLCVENPEQRWARATLDRPVLESATSDLADALGVLEIKNTFIGEHWTAGVPEHVAVQCQWQLYVSGLERAWVAVLFGGRRLQIHVVERDQHAIDLLVEVAGEFWQRIQDRTPPPVDAHRATADALAAAWAGEVDNDDRVDLDDHVDLVEQLRAAKAVEGEAGTEVSRIENELKALLADRGVGTIDGEPVVTWKAAKAFDETRFRAEHPDQWEKFQKFDGSALKEHDPKLYAAFQVEGGGARRFLLTKPKKERAR
jgi:putative phage-type endonuclease